VILVPPFIPGRQAENPSLTWPATVLATTVGWFPEQRTFAPLWITREFHPLGAIPAMRRLPSPAHRERGWG